MPKSNAIGQKHLSLEEGRAHLCLQERPTIMYFDNVNYPTLKQLGLSLVHKCTRQL